MRPMDVKVGPEIEQLVFEICRSPKQNVIQILPSNGLNHVFSSGTPHRRKEVPQSID